jgi:hypothetical protein
MQLVPLVLSVLMAILLPAVVFAQGLTGALIGTVKDVQGGVLPGAAVRIASPALIGGPVTVPTNQKGQFRFPVLPPGRYGLDVELAGFSPSHDRDIEITAGGTVEQALVLQVAGVAESIVVEGAGSRTDARDSGLATRFGPEDLKTIPTRRTSMFDFIRAAPGISPTSPSSATATTVSAFGSGTNENTFLIDGTNFTCPCNGIARSEPGVDFIQEIQVQSVGASAEYGNVQGAIINVVTRQGGARFLYDASYYGQPAGLTSQPVRLAIPGSPGAVSGYTRVKYRDFTTNVGGPAVRDRVWFFAGYQYLRDYDSQPGTDPRFPRAYEQDKIFAKVTWRPAPGWQVIHSIHDEFWANPEAPTFAKPFETTLRLNASVPALTFAHITHTSASNTVWEARAGRFVYDRKDFPSTGDLTTPSHLDRATGVTSGAPPSFGGLTLIRTTAKATLNHYRPALAGADHQWKVGTEIEKGEGHGPNVIPTGVRYEDSDGQPLRSISSEPSHTGGMFVTASAFVSDAITIGDRLTVNAGLRFDHSRAISQDLRAVDAAAHETDRIVPGIGTLYTWNVWSPRFGVTAKLTRGGGTMLRASSGRFYQGVLTGEFSAFHPAVAPVITRDYVPADGDYTRIRSVVDGSNLQIDSRIRPPHTDEYSVGVDRAIRLALSIAAAYVHKQGHDFIAWTDIGGQYDQQARALADGRTVTAFNLRSLPATRRFLLTNPDGYSMNYDGFVTAVEKRRSHGWQALASYTLSRASGLQASSGTTAAGAQSSTVALPNGPFGRDPNDLTNARGRLANDRPHVFRVMGSTVLVRTGLMVSASFQYFSGKPWAASALLDLNQGQQRVLLEPRGSRRLSSQSLLDLRLSRSFGAGRASRIELLLDVLNALNDAGEEGLATDVQVTEKTAANPGFAQPTVFMDPRPGHVWSEVEPGSLTGPATSLVRSARCRNSAAIDRRRGTVRQV